MDGRSNQFEYLKSPCSIARGLHRGHRSHVEEREGVAEHDHPSHLLEVAAWTAGDVVWTDRCELHSLLLWSHIGHLSIVILEFGSASSGIQLKETK
jgi:hypothetical protein